MYASRRQSAGFTIIELMIVVVFLSIAVAMLLPQMNATFDQQAIASARVLVSEFEYARNMAVANNSKYRLSVDSATDQFILEHTGSNSSLDTLPSGPFRSSADSSTQRVTQLASLPGISTAATFVAMYADGDSQTAVNTVEFGSLGETSRTETTVLTISVGDGDAKRYVTLTINPVTGIVTLGDSATTAGDWEGDAIPSLGGGDASPDDV